MIKTIIKKKIKGSTYKSYLLIGAVSVLSVFLLISAIFPSKVSADTRSTGEISGYERILIRPGDTLDTISALYSEKYAFGNASEYKADIKKINALSSDYIKEGVYLLMPVYNI